MLDKAFLRKIIVTALLLGVAAPKMTSAVPIFHFPDVKKQKSYYDAITYLINEDVIEGYPNGLFLPKRPATRAEVAKMITESLHVDPEKPFEIQFTDVNPEKWYYPHIATLVQSGMMGGYQDGTFRPDQPITRAEVVKILDLSYELTKKPQKEEMKFEDISNSDWFFHHVQNLYYADLIEGNTFSPTRQVTRGEVASFIFQMKKNNGK